ncbi:MAG: hypothetical protein FWH37_06830 [Candidatus Bathyarchaeota archaeon]|nr:hypothetical protein [Candidatus Termiticorpusculum sp.]
MNICVMGRGNVEFPVMHHISKICGQTQGYNVFHQVISVTEKQGVSMSNMLDCVIVVSTWCYDNPSNIISVGNYTKFGSNSFACFESTFRDTIQLLTKKCVLSNVTICSRVWWKQKEVEYGVAQFSILYALNQKDGSKTPS